MEIGYCFCKTLPAIKCKDRVLEYLRERRDRDVGRVDDVGVRGRSRIKCMDKALEYLR